MQKKMTVRDIADWRSPLCVVDVTTKKHEPVPSKEQAFFCPWQSKFLVLMV